MKNRVSYYLILLTFLAVLGCNKSAMSPKTEEHSKVDHYTCAMHPSVISQDPNGKCPICAMDLVPVMKAGMEEPMEHHHGETELHSFTVPVERQQMIGVTYGKAEIRPLRQTIRAVGMVAPDKLRHYEFTARVDGYVEKLHVSSPGELVEKDQPLLTIYSPELAAAERELISVLDSNNPRLLEASRRRLAQWNLTPMQISEIEKTRHASDHLTLLSPFRGIVEAVPVDVGRRITVSDHLVDVVDLSQVWVWIDFYENETPLLTKGKKVALASSAYPGETFEGTVALIDPFTNEMQRTTRVRVDLPNPDLKLRPGMYLDAELTSDLGEGLTIPESAILPTGKKNIVFVGKGQGKLEPRIVQLGRKVDDFYEVLSGLAEGESIVTSANFLIDAESRLQGAVKFFEAPKATDTLETAP